MRRSEDRPSLRDQRGVALFMVIGAIAVLSILVTEFTYIAQVNQRMAYDGLEQLRAHYLAKTGLKLSLLRLKAYQNVKGVVGSSAGGASAMAAMIPPSLIEKIWSFPFLFPIPTSVPGMTPGQKEQIAKFTKESGLDGQFTAVIESESQKFNLNSILPAFAPLASPSPGPSASPTVTPSASPSPSFSKETARKTLGQFLENLWLAKTQADPDFAAEHRDFRVDEFTDSLVAWADRTYERRILSSRDYVPLKQAPFYSVSELRMIAPMNDALYDVFAPSLTALPTEGLNVNTMTEGTLRALLPRLNDEDLKEFLAFRDSTENDNRFKKVDDFYKALAEKTRSYGSEKAVEDLKKEHEEAGFRLTVDESRFKITVTAKAGQVTRILEAWVQLESPSTQPPESVSARETGPRVVGSGNAPQDTGLRITFMRFL
jgi:type II secretory pathway component PulK